MSVTSPNGVHIVATHSFECPCCRAVLKSSSATEPGKKIQCPKCSTVFQLAAPPPDSGDRETAPNEGIRDRRRRDDPDDRPIRSRRRYEDDDEEDFDDYDRPRRRKNRRKMAASSRAVLWWVLGGAGSLLLVGLAVALVWMFRGGVTQARLVGKWALDNPLARNFHGYEFRSDGTFTQGTLGFQITGTYRVSGNTLTLGVERGNFGINVPGGQLHLQIVSVDATQLILEGPNRMGQTGRLVFKRVQ
jgi:hypothetical protein